MDNIVIRNETESDYREVEEMTRKAFWNVYKPGGDEHYLSHILRTHPDFIKELDYVIELDGKIVANIMYTKATLTDENGAVKDILSFGPLCVHPDVQRRGFGKAIMKATFEKAAELGYDTVVIYGNPENYIPAGFKNCKKFNVTVDGEHFPVSLLVIELKKDALDGRRWTFALSSAFDFDEAEAEEYDKYFEPMEKGYDKKQELFYIYSRSNVVR